VPVYRVVGRCPPTADDFLSYLLAGRMYPPSLFLRAFGLSMCTKEKEARKLAKGGEMGSCIATLDLSQAAPALFALTSKRTGHITVWTAPTRDLLNHVLDCVDTREGTD